MPTGASRESSRTFPGKFARASLKLLDKQARGYSVRFFPGQIRPGLIEADQIIHDGIGNPRTFPGKFARASLKHDLLHLVDVQVAAFPGKFARASLKQEDLAPVITLPRDLSRANSPGPH